MAQAPSHSNSGSGSSSREWSPMRRRIADLSHPALRWLSRQPRWLVAGAVMLLVVGGLAAPRPWGPVCLGVVTALLAWLAYLSWPEGDRRRRMIRLAMVLLAVVAFALRVVQ